MTKPTREERTLDLLLTNVAEWFGDVRVTKNIKFLDHNTVSMDHLVDILHAGRKKKDVFTNVYWSKLSMLDNNKVTCEMWEEYQEYLNDSDWHEVTEGMDSSDKYDFLIRTIEEAALSVLREKPMTKHPRVPKDIRNSTKRN